MVNLARSGQLGGNLNWFDYVMGYYKLTRYVEAYDLVDLTWDPLLWAIEPSYHNPYHTKLVVLHALEGAIQSGFDPKGKQIRVLLVAALFHDAGHYQGEVAKAGQGYLYASNPDDLNIDEALGEIYKAHYRLGRVSGKELLNEEEMLEARQLIRWTVYPRKPHSEPTLMGKILQDADLMTVYCHDSRVAGWLIKGLYEEFKKTKPELTYSEFDNQQLQFARKVVWNTRWANIKAVQANFFQRISSLKLRAAY